MKILVMDDSHLERKLLISILQKGGVKNEILQAPDGKVGFEVLSKEYKDIGLILVDSQMPEIDGLEFLRKMTQNPELASIPAVMISAAGGEESREIAELLNPNLAGYLVKPFEPEELMQTISKYIK